MLVQPPSTCFSNFSRSGNDTVLVCKFRLSDLEIIPLMLGIPKVLHDINL